ncbi:MAG: DUF5666 domain-containing protein [Terracidiphilus sp.]|jgi:hypothetical protein
MKNKMKSPVPAWMVLAGLTIALLAALPMARAQGAAAVPPSRFLGTITAIAGDTLTVKSDADGVRQFEVPAAAAIKRIAPGQKDLSTAAAIQFSDLAVGDRALVKLDPNAPAGVSQALQIIAIKQEDVALKQQKDREDWQRRGVGGLVKSVDSAGGAIVLTSGVGATAKTITVHTTKATVLKRYAPASVSYDAAQSAPIDAIHAGDQLQARGTKNADGTEMAAEEVISGTFRNISGIIGSLDPASSTLVLKDLATKKQVTIHITPDAQMRRLPDMIARVLAARLKGDTNGSGSGRGGNAQPANGGAGAAAGGAGTGQRGGSGQWAGQGSGQAGRPGGDPMQMLSRAPAIQFADLKKGDAVMLVSTDGATDVTAITLLAGVEPLLEAPAASQMLLNNWSMNSGAGAAEAEAQ